MTRWIVVTLLVVASAGCASGPDTASSGVEETTLKVGVAFLNQRPDPVVNGGLSSVAAGLAETLFKLNHALRPEPWLATGARQVDDRTWQVTLREGVKFHDGQPMDAAAVKASLERDLARWPPAKNLLDIARITVDGPSTLTIVTTRPSPMMPALLADSSTAIVSVAAADAMRDGFADKPVLTGPFKVERFELNKELVAVRHTGYWGPPPRLDRVVMTYIGDSPSRVLALQRGEVDLVEYLAPEGVAAVKGTSNLQVMSVASVAVDFMYFNQRREPWKDARVRRAVTLCCRPSGSPARRAAPDRSA